MSYARHGCDGSDVDVYHSSQGYVCQECSIWPPDKYRRKELHYVWTCATPAQMLEHVQAHRAAGQCVPEYALERLRGDVEAGGYRADGYPEAIANALRKGE